MNTPERIWVTDTTTPPYIAIIPDQSRPWPQDNPYILATPEALAKSPEVQALIVEAVAEAVDAASIAALRGIIRAAHFQGRKSVSLGVLEMAADELRAAAIRERGGK